MTFDEYFMSLVYLIAMKSKDESTHIGAVVVDQENRIVSTGYNSFPSNIIDDNPARQSRENGEKYYWFEHAERNAVFAAAKNGGPSLKNCKMYTNGIPCMDCARSIVQSGIKEVIVDAEWSDVDTPKWHENSQRTLILFREAKVELKIFNGKIVRNIKKYQRGREF